MSPIHAGASFAGRHSGARADRAELSDPLADVFDEELKAAGDDLQGAIEALETMNAELSTMNAQLHRRVGELEAISGDLRDLLAGGEVATLFLDTRMRIRWFTPAIKPLFDLIDTDIGRPIANFTPKFAEGDLVGKAEAAAARLASAEEEVSADNGRTYLLRVSPYRTRDNRIAGATATFIDITERKAVEIEAETARRTAEAIAETVREPLIVLDAGLRVRSVNAAFCRLFRISATETVGQPVYQLAHSRWDTPALRLWLESLVPDGPQIHDLEVAMVTPVLGRRDLVLTARRLDGPGEGAELILLAIEDVTARRVSSRHRDILIAELSQRVKDTLTAVQSIAARTLRSSPSIEAFNEAFLGRLHALAGAHDLIIEGSWNGVEVRSALERALQPFGLDDRVALSPGPSLGLHSQAALALAMTLHELASNAVRHGALSAPAGRVAVAWGVRDDASASGRTLVLDWIESGGPPVQPPSRRGHGIRYVARSLADELGGSATLDFDRAGLRARLEISLAAAVMSADGARTDPMGQTSGA